MKDGAIKDDELLDSIWLTVEKANKLSLHQNQLQKDYTTFSEPEKPFIRTDKGTVKRRATLAVYADYIERFYSSRDVDPGDATVDTSSVEAVLDSVRIILGSLLPAVYRVSPDTDLFSLGLDSLQVFRAIKIIRAAIGLQDQLSPRHLYANPTLSKFSIALERLVTETKLSQGLTPDDLVDEDLARIKKMIEKHKARQSFKLNPFDYVNPNHYLGLSFYFALRKDVSFEQTFANLQEGLRHTFDLIPALDGKMMVCSEQEIGYTKGDLCVTIPSIRWSTSSKAPRQLAYKDLSQILPSFEQLRDGGFVPSAFRDKIVLEENTFPSLPADILVAQANFVEGGCILSVNLNHCCLDGVGAMIAIKVWAESCRYLQGDVTATCSWLDPESFNHSLPEILYEQEGYARPAADVDPGVWGFLPFLPPEKPLDNNVNGTVSPGGPKEQHLLPPPPPFPHRFVWPPPPVQNGLSTTMFLISPEKVQKLQQEVLADPAAKGIIKSISDIMQAFFWRAAIRARYRVATDLRGETFGPEDISVLELPVDGRPYFSSLLPSSYMGSMLILNRPNMPIETLCSPETSIGSIAYLVREAAARITPSLVHDAFTLMQSLPDHSRFTTACMGLEGMHAMISNLMLFDTSEISFGDGFFAHGGSPAAMRPLVERGHKRFRFLVIHPMRDDGGVELGLARMLKSCKC